MWDEAVRLVVVTGTGTEVGKTWFGAATLQAARDLGVRVTARKPVQSFTAGEGPTDADVLAASTGEDPETVCPPHRWLPVAMAPPMAAAALALPPFTIADLAAEIRASLPAFRTAGASPTRPATQLTADTPTSGLRTTAAGHLVLVEGAGGPRSPLSDDGDTVDLAAALDPDAVVLVADAGLGVISAVHLCAEALSGHPLVVALNRFDPLDELHALNCAWLRERVGLDVVTDPASLAARLLTP